MRQLFSKHLILQYGRLKDLTSYASQEIGSSTKFTFGLGFLSRGLITGAMTTLPQKWQVYRLGKVRVHLFCPDDPSDLEVKMPDEMIAKVAVYAPATVELNAMLRAKDEQLREKDRKIEEMGRQMSAMATELDAYRTIIRTFTTDGVSPKEIMMAKKLDAFDIITLIFPTAAGYYVAEFLEISPILGVFAGLFLGVALIFRRKGGAD